MYDSKLYFHRSAKLKGGWNELLQLFEDSRANEDKGADVKITQTIT